MARKKKSRKVGQIGIPKSPDGKRPPKNPDRKPKKVTGRAPGSRHSAAQTDQHKAANVVKDPRVGSKKPVALVVDEKKSVVKKKPTFFSPAQELASIENDNRLAQLLDKIDEGQNLSKEQQQYVDGKLARHKVLCDLLGISPDPDDDDEDELSRIDTSELDAFKEDWEK